VPFLSGRAGKAGTAFIVGALRQGLDGLAHLRKRLLELLRSLRIGARDLAAQLSLSQSQQQLLARRLVDRLRSRARVELGDQRHEIRFGLPAVDEVGPQPPVQLAVEVVRAHLAEHRDELGMDDAPGQRFALEPLVELDPALEVAGQGPVSELLAALDD